eukprot:TRINITY_DN2852_c0_g1_i1.p1 TRINITY_DN2852_c0_g1~~TRINITY_DN2852_c0_g1_i1.p1  ORF type:complete len:925 (+),score=355.02 TRINITY_DN2852_c0_g1_i1:100-2775(+)
MATGAPSREEMGRIVYAVLGRRSRSGRPAARDFEETLQELNLQFSPDTVTHLFSRADINSDGEVSPTEFSEWAETYPRVVECIYFRVMDLHSREQHEERVAAAVGEREALEKSLRRCSDDTERARRAAEAAERALTAQMRDLERAREDEARRRALDDAERQDTLTTTQGAMITAALDKTSDGVCAEKRDQQYASIDASQVRAFADRLVDEWRRKDGDVVDELVTNLAAPDSIRSKLAVLAEAGRHLQQTKSSCYPGRNRVELLVMALYTMAGPDIDALMTYDDAPVFDEKHPEVWEQYCKQHGKTRNGAVFSAINWAMRTGADPKQAGDEAWGTIRKWIKYICLLLALCAQEEPSVAPDGARLARGLAGLPAVVFDAHRSMTSGEALHWPAASSCALDRHVSESYIRGEAANATKLAGGSVLFLISAARWGVLLQSISKYPKESEMLLPPLFSFDVEAVRAEASLPGSLVIDLKCKGHSAPTDFVDQVLRAAKQSADRLQSALVQHAESQLQERQRELEHKRQQERLANGDVLRTEREVERQHGRVAASKLDAARAEERLKELEQLLHKQKSEVERQKANATQCEEELQAAEEAGEAARSLQQEVVQQVAQAKESVQEAEEQLCAVKEAKESKKQEAASKLGEAMEQTRQGEVEREKREQELAMARDAEQRAQMEEERAQAAVSEADLAIKRLREQCDAMEQRRRQLDAEEQPILEQEVRLVEQRQALEFKEHKHRSDLRTFGSQWRPAPPGVGGSGVPPPRRASADAGAAATAAVPPPYSASCRQQQQQQPQQANVAPRRAVPLGALLGPPPAGGAPEYPGAGPAAGACARGSTGSLPTETASTGSRPETGRPGPSPQRRPPDIGTWRAAGGGLPVPRAPSQQAPSGNTW